MRWIIVSLLLFTGAVSDAALAQSAPLVRTIASHLTLIALDQANYRLQCPSGYIPVGYSMNPQYEYDENTEMTRDLIDKNRVTINRTSLSGAAPLDGGGYAVSLFNEEHHQHDLEVMVTCLATATTARADVPLGALPRPLTMNARTSAVPES